MVEVVWTLGRHNVEQRPPKQATLVQALDGLLVGYYLRR